MTNLSERPCIDTAQKPGQWGCFDHTKRQSLGTAPHRLTPSACLAGEN
ncbi:hypothetical protein M2170_009696, partial [Bradyrhizobium japonicum]|nr:hypothetical protein [Bradyrhizobium japonicum]